MNVYFYCYPHGPADRAGYEHEIVALAEGLIELGHTPKGNVNYWLKSTKQDDYLIKQYEPKDLNEFDVIVFSSVIYDYQRQDILPKNIFDANRKYKLVFIDAADGLITPGYSEELRQVDFVLKSHYCNKYKYPKNFVPWQIGLTNRIIDYATRNSIHFDERNGMILSNFRVGHTLRQLVEDISQQLYYPIYSKNMETDRFEENSMEEIDKIFWTQTGKRHYPSYYKRLNSNIISNAVGGQVQKWTTEKTTLPARIARKIDALIPFLKYDRIYQFDSWRFWESLVSGCATMHVDFEKYGIMLQEMPINGVHYIGIDLDNPERILKCLKDKNQLRKIAENGKNWALKYYSPKAVANRFLNLLKG